MVKIHDVQYQLKVPFMLYEDFESILNPVDEQYREKMNKMKTKRKGKAPYTEEINTCTVSMMRTTFAYGDVPDPLKMNLRKDCVEMFIEYTGDEVKRFYETFPQQPMTAY